MASHMTDIKRRTRSQSPGNKFKNDPESQTHLLQSHDDYSHSSNKNYLDPKKQRNKKYYFVGGASLVAVIFILLYFFVFNGWAPKSSLLKEAKESLRVNDDSIVLQSGEIVKYGVSVPPPGIQSQLVDRNLPDVLLVHGHGYDSTLFSELGTFQYLSLHGFRVFGIDLPEKYLTINKEENNDNENISFLDEVVQKLGLKHVVVVTQGSSAHQFGLPLVLGDSHYQFNLEGLGFAMPKNTERYDKHLYKTIRTPCILIYKKNHKSFYDIIPTIQKRVITTSNRKKFAVKFHDAVLKWLGKHWNYVKVKHIDEAELEAEAHGDEVHHEPGTVDSKENPIEHDGEHPEHHDGDAPEHHEGDVPEHHEGHVPEPHDDNVPKHPDGNAPEHPDGDVPEHHEGDVPEHSDGDAPEQHEGDVPEHHEGDVPKHPDGDVPEHNDNNNIPKHPDGDVPEHHEGDVPEHQDDKAPEHHDDKAPDHHEGDAPEHHDDKAPEHHDDKAPEQHEGDAPEQHDDKAPEQPEGDAPGHLDGKAPEHHDDKAPEQPEGDVPDHHEGDAPGHLDGKAPEHEGDAPDQHDVEEHDKMPPGGHHPDLKHNDDVHVGKDIDKDGNPINHGDLEDNVGKHEG